MYSGIYDSIRSNRFKSMMLVITFPALVFAAVIGTYAIIIGSKSGFGPNTLNQALIMSYDILSILGPVIFIRLLISFAFHKQLIFGFSGAREITRKDYPQIYNIVENLCISRGLPTPNIGILDDDSMNAFATGWNPKDSRIVFSRGILNRLDKSEIEAVAGHELTHIMNKDSMLMLIIILFVGIIATVGEIMVRFSGSFGSNDDKKGSQIQLIMIIVGIVLMILGYLVFPLIRLAISRKREFLADAGSVQLTMNKEAMISALRKISQDSTIESIKKQTVAAMCIQNPFNLESGTQSFMSEFLLTHPSIESRIKALESY